MTSPTKDPLLEEAPALDLAALFHAVLFTIRATFRHRLLALACFLGCIAVSAVVLTLMPRAYTVDTRVLTEPDTIMGRLTGDNRSAGTTERATQRASELIRARSNLGGIVDDIDLADQWDKTRTKVGKLKDQVRAILMGPLSESDMREALIEMLEERVWVRLEGDVVIISVTWSSPETAVSIAHAATERFFATRRERELAEIEETIRVLDSQVQAQRRITDRTAETVRSEWALRNNRRPVAAPREPSAPPPDPRLQQVEDELALKRAEITRIESAYQRDVEKARDALNGLRTTLGPRHPDVLDAVRTLESVSRAPPELAQLRVQEAKLSLELRNARTNNNGSHRTTEVKQAIQSPARLADPEFDLLLKTYQDEEKELAFLVNKLEGAKIEREVAKVAFGYRYMVTLPPIPPNKPSSPKAPKVLFAGAGAGIILGILFAVMADLRSKIVFERWQVERTLRLPVVGEVDAR